MKANVMDHPNLPSNELNVFFRSVEASHSLACWIRPLRPVENRDTLVAFPHGSDIGVEDRLCIPFNVTLTFSIATVFPGREVPDVRTSFQYLLNALDCCDLSGIEEWASKVDIP
jgi:hypothetical protein